MPELLTASEIACETGRSRQAVARLLTTVPSDAVKVVQGVDVKAWRLESLPARLADMIQRTASKLYEPKIPMGEIAQPCIDKALDRRKALSRTMERIKDRSIPSAELERLCIEDCKAVYGREITDRTVRNWIAAAVKNDGGREDWQRLEIYLPKNIYRIGAKAPKVCDEEQNLLDEITYFKNPAAPSEEDKRYFWNELFYACEQMSAARLEKQVKRELMDFVLKHAQWLAATRTALHVAWQRNFTRWLNGGKTPAAFDDLRSETSGRFRAPKPTDNDLQLLTAVAAKFGSIEKAWVHCLGAKQLSANVSSYYAGSPRCPRLIRDRIKHDVQLQIVNLHGRNAAKSAGAFVDRDPDSIASGDWDQSDDMTFVNVVYEETPDGLYVGQPQLLVWVDERSWFIYAWHLISDKAYNGFSIRNSWTAKAAEWGLPRKGLALERGIWQRSRVIVGRPDDIDPQETERGLKRLGLRFHHYTHGRGKIIESVYRLCQVYLQTQQGYVGRNALSDRHEDVQKQLREVKTAASRSTDLGRAAAAKYFLNKAQWMDVLERIFMEFNRTPMRGKYHNDRSPEQVFQECFTTKLKHVEDEHRWLFASNKIVKHVGNNGITFQFGNKTFIYKNARTGELRGHSVICWFNPERPEFLPVTDMDGQNLFVVERAARPGMHDEDHETLKLALKQNAEHNAYAKGLSRSMKRHYKSDFFKHLFLPTLADGGTAKVIQMSCDIKRQTDELTAAQKQQQKARRKASALGIPSGTEIRDPDQLLDALDDLEAARARLSQEQTT